MTIEEAKSAFEELRKQGMTNEDIAKSLFNMFQVGKIDYEQFEAFVGLLGFELKGKKEVN